MGLILPAGIVVKTSNLLIDFVAGEWAIGLERLPPLATVAIGGLLVSTFLTMVYVPVLYSPFDDAQAGVGRMFRGSESRAAPVAL